MPITELPVLPATYPLFDWNDWPASYAALVPGGPTKAFEKACWNSIVEYVEEVVEASGLEWWSDVYTADIIKMLSEGNAPLKAGHMNNLRMAVDNMVALPWRWEYDKEFRGYIGRPYFNNSIYTEQDIVYPEYFTEMVRHINKVVEILRGTSDLEITSGLKQKSFSRRTVQAERKRAGAVIPRNRISHTSVSMLADSVILGGLIDFPEHRSKSSVIPPDWLRGVIIYNYIQLYSGVNVSGDKAKAASSSARLKMNSLQYAELDYATKTLEASAQLWMHSSSKVSVQKNPSVGMGTDVITRSKQNVGVIQTIPENVVPSAVQSFFKIRNPEIELILPYEITSVRHRAVTSRSAAVSKSQALPIVPQVTSETAADARIIQKPSLPTSAAHISESAEEVNAIAAPGAPIHAEVPAKIRTQNPVQNYRSAPIFTEAPTGTKIACSIELYDGWDYPEWVDGGLWIKQAHTITRYENGELEVR